MKIFSGSNAISLATKVASILDVPLSPVETHIFPDGERRIRIEERVVDEQAVIIHSPSTPVDSNYMELFFMIDALKRSGSKEIIGVIPYFGYQRQDHIFRDGEAVSLEVIIHILETLGLHKVISFDLHSIKIPELFHIPVSHISALPLFAKTIIDQQWNNTDTILVSPDMGGIRRIKILSSLLNDMQYTAIEKNRNLVTGAVSAENFHGQNIEGKKRAILVDDMISSGGTIQIAADMLYAKGIKEIYTFVTHPIFSTNAIATLQNSVIKKIYVTDTVVVPENKKFKKLKILSIAQDISNAITENF